MVAERGEMPRGAETAKVTEKDLVVTHSIRLNVIFRLRGPAGPGRGAQGGARGFRCEGDPVGVARSGGYQGGAGTVLRGGAQRWCASAPDHGDGALETCF